MLTPESFKSARDFIRSHARPLEQSLFASLFEGASAEKVIDSLAEYRNADGGYGHGLEPDFWTPASSCIATSDAFRYLDEANVFLEHPFYLDGIQFFVKTFDAEYKGWEQTPPDVNDAPHAPWWDCDADKKADYFENHWANCGAEVLGYLYRFPGKVPEPIVKEQEAIAIKRLRAHENGLDMHEFICYHRLARSAPSQLKEVVLEALRAYIPTSVALTEDQWRGYSLRPIWVVESPTDPLAPELQEVLLRYLQFEIGQQGPDGAWSPFWSWGRDQENWKKAEQAWKGILTLRFLRVLKNFDLIEEM